MKNRHQLNQANNKMSKITDFSNKEFVDEMMRRFVVPQFYTRQQLFEKIKNYDEKLTNKAINKIIDDVKRNMYQNVDEMVDEYAESYKENESYQGDSSSEDESEDEDEQKDDFAECCRCFNDVSTDEGEGKCVDGEYWCVDCLEEAHKCEMCNSYTKETEYLPSKEDQEKQQILGNDYCLECYKKVEKFEFVENIKDKEKKYTTEYTNCLCKEQVEWLDLFDDIPYKHIKDTIKDEDYDLEVEITDLECDRVAWCKTKFEFELKINISGGSLPLYVDKKFEVIKEYNNSSPMALFMLDLQLEVEESEEE